MASLEILKFNKIEFLRRLQNISISIWDTRQAVQYRFVDNISRE